MYYGLRHELRLWKCYIADYFRWRNTYRKCTLADKSFRLNGQDYPYFIHPYNHTWANERAVEIAVIKAWMGDHDPHGMLEVGNVLSHYMTSPHTVLDKYERGVFRKVVRQDIVDFSPDDTYTSMASISTIEHVGWDEEPRNPPKVLDVFPKIQTLLAPGGTALLTFPVGYNSFLDQAVREGQIHAVQTFCLKRISFDNEWEETNILDAMSFEYGSPYQNANAVVFLELSNGTSAEG